MTPTSRLWLRTALVVAVVYAVTGIVTVAASRAAGAAGMPMAVRAIRGLSWLWSAIVFLLHTVLENRSRPKLAIAAWHTSAAVAIATLALAAVAAARQMGEGNRRPAVFLAIAVWPIMTGVVSFVVGMVLGAVLRGAARGSK